MARIKIPSISVVTKIIPTNKIHIHRFIVILNQSRQRHIIRIRRNTVGRNNFGNNAYRGNFNPRPYPSNPSNNYGNSYNNSYGNYNKMPSDFESNIKEFISLQKNFNAMIEEKSLKIDDLLGTLIEFLLMLIL